MELSSWSDEAVASAASLTGSAALCVSMGLPTSRAASIRSAAQAELSKRRVKRDPPLARDASRPRRMSRPTALLADFLKDRITLSALGLLTAFVSTLRMSSRRSWNWAPALRPPPRFRSPPPLTEPEFPPAAAYENHEDHVRAVADWMADPAVRIRTRFEGIHSYGVDIWDEIGGKLDADNRRRSRATSVQVNAVLAYVRWQIGDLTNRFAPAACYDLDRALIAFCNVSAPEYLSDHLRTLRAARGSEARRLKLAKMAAEGREILNLYPLAGYLFLGAPTAKWPIKPPEQVVVDAKSQAGDVAIAGVKPPGG